MDGRPSGASASVAREARTGAQTAAMELERARAAAAAAHAAVESLRREEGAATAPIMDAAGAEMDAAALSAALRAQRASNSAAGGAGRRAGRDSGRSGWGDRERDAAAALERELSMLTQEYAQAAAGLGGVTGGMGRRSMVGIPRAVMGALGSSGWPPELLEAAAAGLALPPSHGHRGSGGRGLSHGGHGSGETSRGTVLGMVRERKRERRA